MMRVLLPTNHPNPQAHFERLERQAAGAPGAFDYQVVAVGQIGHASIYYDPSLGAPGKLLAEQMYHVMPQVIVHCELYFGAPVRDFNVIIAPLSGLNDGTGGAYHYGCDFETGRTIYVDASFGNPHLERGLIVAELTECQMGQQNAGWGCGSSNGEALSRLLAEMESGGPLGALSGFSSAPTWDQMGRPNWIDKTAPTDQDYVSVGCGMVYLYWMLSLSPQFSVSQIIKAGGATLALNWAALTGRPSVDAWPSFMIACDRFPAQTIASDNPWGGGHFDRPFV